MTSDEARKLLGGYATGSLTEAEKTALFQAALEDQELFDELAGEQVLKEVLDQPGARQRLIAALEPPRQRAWLWVTAAATAGLAIVVGVVVGTYSSFGIAAPIVVAWNKFTDGKGTAMRAGSAAEKRAVSAAGR